MKIKIAIITNKKSPYRKLQIEKIATNKNYNINVYYTDSVVISRKWKIEKMNDVQEIELRKEGNKNHILNNIIKIVKDSDVLIIGGYDKFEYILLGIIAKLKKKPYIILHDGISPTRIRKKERIIKHNIKKIIINNASAFFANGLSSKEYFFYQFKRLESEIFNQFLTVDVETIKEISNFKIYYRETLRANYDIKDSQKVILYSGRLIKRKNVDVIIESLSKINNKQEYTLLVLGDGEERHNLISLANKKGVTIKITGFIEDQRDLFKHYLMGDVLVLPSCNEPWGLVVNEAMAAGLPVIVSNECGSSLDLVKDNCNGFVVNAGNSIDLKDKIEFLFKKRKIEEFGEKSKEIISEWTYEKSSESFTAAIEFVNKKI